MSAPVRLELIGNEIAIAWENGEEDYLPMEFLRAASPSAENMGERDLLGRTFGGSDQTEFPGVVITGWSGVGAYAVKFDFSDGHSTGIYTYEYLKYLGETWRQMQAENPTRQDSQEL